MNYKKRLLIFLIFSLIISASFAQTEITNDMVFSILENKSSKYDQYGQGFQKAFLKLLQNNNNKEPFEISDAVVQELETRQEKFSQKQKIGFSIGGVIILSGCIALYCFISKVVYNRGNFDAEYIKYVFRVIVGPFLLAWLGVTLITEKARKRYNVFLKMQQILIEIKQQKNTIKQAKKRIEETQKNKSRDLLKIASTNWF